MVGRSPAAIGRTHGGGGGGGGGRVNRDDCFDQTIEARHFLRRSNNSGGRTGPDRGRASLARSLTMLTRVSAAVRIRGEGRKKFGEQPAPSRLVVGATAR